MPRDSRTIQVLQSGAGFVERSKRAGDKFIYDIQVAKALGPEGWLNSVDLDAPLHGPACVNVAGIAQVSATEAWAVGSVVDASGVANAMAQHTTDSGTTWTKVTVPQKQKTGAVATDNYLTSVTAVSASEVYAAGYYYNDNNVKIPFVLKWNGTAWAFTTSSPSAGGATNDQAPAAIVNLGTNSIVVLGNAQGDGNNGTSQGKSYIFASRSTDGGATWTNLWNDGANLPPAASSRSNVVLGALRSSGTNLWACGYYILSSNGAEQNLLLKSTDGGATWSLVSVPNQTGPSSAVANNRLTAVGSNAAANFAVVGYGPDPASAGRQLAYLYYSATGTTFAAPSAVPTPQGTGTNKFLGVVVNGTDAICVGQYVASDGKRKALAQKYNYSGNTWATQTVADPGTGQEAFNAVACYTTAGTPNQYAVTAGGRSGGIALIQRNTYDSSTPGVTFTAQTGDASYVAGVTPPVPVFSFVDESAKSTDLKLTLSGGTAGWSGKARVAFGVSYPRANAVQVANGYRKFLNLLVEVL